MIWRGLPNCSTAPIVPNGARRKSLRWHLAQPLSTADSLLAFDFGNGVPKGNCYFTKLSPWGMKPANTYAYNITMTPTIAASAIECHTTKRKIIPSFADLVGGRGRHYDGLSVHHLAHHTARTIGGAHQH